MRHRLQDSVHTIDEVDSYDAHRCTHHLSSAIIDNPPHSRSARSQEQSKERETSPDFFLLSLRYAGAISILSSNDTRWTFGIGNGSASHRWEGLGGRRALYPRIRYVTVQVPGPYLFFIIAPRVATISNSKGPGSASPLNEIIRIAYITGSSLS